VRYLLDVNALLAFGLREHRFHTRVAIWIKDLLARNDSEIATCAITELGFLRVSTHAAAYGYTLNQGTTLLTQLKHIVGLKFVFLSDDQTIANLPAWVQRTNQITDGHLAGLAKANSALLATLDERIPGSFVIPS
jgi:predicted nucleic acid-binding protein